MKKKDFSKINFKNTPNIHKNLTAATCQAVYTPLLLKDSARQSLLRAMRGRTVKKTTEKENGSVKCCSAETRNNVTYNWRSTCWIFIAWFVSASRAVAFSSADLNGGWINRRWICMMSFDAILVAPTYLRWAGFNLLIIIYVQ